MKPTRVIKTIIIPDIHHRLNHVEKILDYEKPTKTIFLGDWFDDWHDNEKITKQTAEWLAHRIESKPKDVFIWGNHDLAYAYPSKYTMCSGFTNKKCQAVHACLKQAHFDRFVWYAWSGDYLCSHAGLSQGLVPEATRSKKALISWLRAEAVIATDHVKNKQYPHWIYMAGRAVGGIAPFGGLCWCRPSEFIPIKGIKQIMGHTPHRIPYQRATLESPDNWLLDSHTEYYGIMIEGTLAVTNRAFLDNVE